MSADKRESTAFSNDNVQGQPHHQAGSHQQQRGGLPARCTKRVRSADESAGLLMCASDDGVVRLWRGIEQAGKQTFSDRLDRVSTHQTGCQCSEWWRGAGPVDKSSLPRLSPPLHGGSGWDGDNCFFCDVRCRLVHPIVVALSVIFQSPSLCPLRSSSATTPSPPTSAAVLSYSRSAACHHFVLTSSPHRPSSPVTFDWSQSTGHCCASLAMASPRVAIWDVTQASDACWTSQSRMPAAMHGTQSIRLNSHRHCHCR